MGGDIPTSVVQERQAAQRRRRCNAGVPSGVHQQGLGADTRGMRAHRVRARISWKSPAESAGGRRHRTHAAWEGTYRPAWCRSGRRRSAGGGATQEYLREYTAWGPQHAARGKKGMSHRQQGTVLQDLPSRHWHATCGAGQRTPAEVPIPWGRDGRYPPALTRVWGR